MDCVNLIDYKDELLLNKQIIKIFDSPKKDFTIVHNYIKTNFNYQSMLEKYLRVFENVVKNKKLILKTKKSSDYFVLAPWCYVSHKGVYNDYIGDFIRFDDNTLKLLNSKKSFEKKDVLFDFDDLINNDIIVPENE